MEIKKAGPTPLSIEQTTNSEKTAPSSSKTAGIGISSNTKDSYENVRPDIAGNSGAVDPNALVQYVLRESYLQTTEDLRNYAEKVKYFNESKKEMREHLESLKDADANLKSELSNWQPGQTSNVMEALTQVITDSAEETNDGKKYYLNLLAGMNKASEGISEMTQKVAEASQHLAAKEKDDDD